MKRLIAGLALVASCCAGSAFAVDAPSTDVAEQDRITALQLSRGLLTDPRYAYDSRKLDDRLSGQLFDAWLNYLDPERLYLSQADVRGLERYRNGLDKAINSKNLAPFLAMRALVLTRKDACLAYVRGVLAQPMKFDGDEMWNPDRGAAARAADESALQSLWGARLKSQALALKLEGHTTEQIRRALERSYASRVQQAHAVSAAAVVEAIISTLAVAIGPGNDYFSPDPPAPMPTTAAGQVGVGLALKRDGAAIGLYEVTGNGPADRAGLREGDRLLAVGEGRDGAMDDVAGLELEAVVQRLRGAPGSVVRVQVLPRLALPGERARTVELSRAKVDERAVSRVIEVAGKRIGVIVPGSFYVDFDAQRRKQDDYASISRDVRRILQELREAKADAVLVDLRDNGGGALSELEPMIGLFADAGAVFQVRESGGRVSVMDKAVGAVWTAPMAVLINYRSSAASEIFAAAIQDHGRGLVIGERSFGRGTVQNMVDLDRWPNNDKPPRFGQVKLTIAHVYRITGKPLDAVGVTPDLVLTQAPPIEPKRTPTPAIVAYKGFRSPPARADLDRLTQAHQQRSAQDPEYQHWLQRLQLARSTAPLFLNEAARRAQLAQLPALPKTDVELTEAAAILADSLAGGGH